MDASILQIRGLTKRYGPLTAVDAISFVLNPGECLGLLGPNGAGKTTTLSMIAGLVTPDAGEVRIQGRPLQTHANDAKRQIGLVPQDLALYDELTALDNLKLFGALYSLDRPSLAAAISGALKLVGLTDRAKSCVKTFSGGMKRRLNLAAALLHDPQLLLLDEPTVGVDPQSRNAIFENISAMRARGKTVLYTTHYMEEVERLCDRVVIMDRGKIVADGTVADLRTQGTNGCRLRLELANPGGGAWLSDLEKTAGVQSCELKGNRLVVAIEDLAGGAAAVLRCLAERGQTIVHIESDRPNLESVFLEMTGRNLRDK